MHSIRKIRLFYFSGTGNSKKVAHWFAEFAREKGIICQIENIVELSKKAVDTIENDCLVGIISPIHGFNYPKITLNFIQRLPKGTNRVLLMNTRGSVKIGRFITPGLTGIAFLLSSFILRQKGYHIIGEIPFDMPSNWISIHPALRERSINYIMSKSYSRAKKHFERLYSGENDFSSRKEIIQDLLISPVSLAYYLAGRFFLAKSYYASYQCTNCNLCIKHCPVQAITRREARPFWTFKCESCMKCMNHCPVNAIETPHALWLVVIYLTSAINSYLFYNILPIKLQHWAIHFLLFNFILMASVWIFYGIQQFLLKSSFAGKILSFTSLSHYPFWGRYQCNKDEKQ